MKDTIINMVLGTIIGVLFVIVCCICLNWLQANESHDLSQRLSQRLGGIQQQIHLDLCEKYPRYVQNCPVLV